MESGRAAVQDCHLGLETPRYQGLSASFVSRLRALLITDRGIFYHRSGHELGAGFAFAAGFSRSRARDRPGWRDFGANSKLISVRLTSNIGLNLIAEFESA